MAGQTITTTAMTSYGTALAYPTPPVNQFRVGPDGAMQILDVNGTWYDWTNDPTGTAPTSEE